jgi:heat-inducible transcriptional repressor
MWKPISLKSIGKQDRERKVLLGVVDYYIQTGKPVGSNTLKEAGFGDLSSATIRNYFANLEEAGYLTQSHSSGGRIPTYLAYRIYAETYLEQDFLKLNEDQFQSLRQFDSREIAVFLQESAELLSKMSQCAVFLSAPRFDHDFVIDIRLVALDALRCLCVLVTDFGVVQTELLHLPVKLSSFAIKRIEGYFHWRLTGIGQPENLEPEEEAIGQAFYNELMLRYIVGYSNFVDEDIYRTGFSHLLAYSDFQDTKLLASGLSLFENVHSMRLLLKECIALDRLKFWIGDDLNSYVSQSNCSVIAIPYYINHKPVGAVGLLGPARLPYRTLFSILRLFSECVSETLTRTIYKFKISFRQPETGKLFLQKEEYRLIGQSRLILLEDKRTREAEAHLTQQERHFG